MRRTPVGLKRGIIADYRNALGLGLHDSHRVEAVLVWSGQKTYAVSVVG